MADPLSIAASVAGLLSIAVKISTVVSGFVSSANDAPDSAPAALSAMQQMILTLLPVRQLMHQLFQMPKERKEIIPLWHLVVIFRESILSIRRKGENV